MTRTVDSRAGPPVPEPRAPLPPAAALESIRRRIEALGLDLRRMSVLTEAATGPYACTAVIAALAGARVMAVARDTSRYGSARDAAAETLGLARAGGVADRIEVVERVVASRLAACDIITNSGHLRPIGRSVVERLKPGAVVALMYEAWEFRPADVDLAACRERGVRVAAVNERHPDVGVFAYLGDLAVRLLTDAGVCAAGAAIAVVCDNPFAPFIEAGLAAAGASATTVASPADLPAGSWRAVLVALNPSVTPPLGDGALRHIARAAPGALLGQFWGDVDRRAARDLGIVVAPRIEPARGHMGVLLSQLGHEPIVRLQAGGLKAAEAVLRGGPVGGDAVAALL